MAAVSGIDWAAEYHDVRHRRRAQRRAAGRAALLPRRGAASSALIELLIGHRVARVAIERPDGLLVGRLLAAGITVLAIHPNQVAAARDRFRAAAGKSDRFDAMVLCELARTDQHRFPALAPCSDRDARAARARRARARTSSPPGSRWPTSCAPSSTPFWPGAARIFADIDSPIALALPRALPQPADARGLGPKRLDAFLARHAYCGRKTPEQLLERLRSAPHRRDRRARDRRPPRRRARPRRRAAPARRRRSASSPARSAAPSAPTPTARSS